LIRVIVTGATGRMGRRLIDLVHADAELSLVGAVTRASQAALGRDAGEIAGIGPIGVALEHDLHKLLPQADVVIDFSVAEATLDYARLVAASQKTFVIGTTGFTVAQRQEIERLSQGFPCFFAPNMSVGVHVMFQALQALAHLLGPGFDVEIIEAHHRTKVDAPSGTALRLASIIAATRGQQAEQTMVYGRQGIIGKRSDTEIGMQVIRAGDIIGEHTVIFGGIGERLELIHRSQSRDTFAHGALRAAKWIGQQKPGLYGMEELLNFPTVHHDERSMP
jgi:4-hydroxy-tetrahydrodipicolinate reductase